MKHFYRLLFTIGLTAIFVACGGAEFTIAPDAHADPTGGSSNTAGVGSVKAGNGSTGGASSCECEPGAAGPQGAPGPVGPAGQQGPAGPAGKDGQSVVCVNDLNNCPPGAPGMTGATGPAGPAGLSGRDGASCSVTDSSNVGTGQAATITCSNGTSTRLLAAVGPKGDTGAPGAPGAAGLTGPQGPAGLPGKNGIDGVSITKSSIYTRDAAPGTGTASVAYCDDANDVVLTGYCTSTVGLLRFGVVNPTEPTAASGWLCASGASPGAAVVCLKVP